MVSILLTASLALAQPPAVAIPQRIALARMQLKEERARNAINQLREAQAEQPLRMRATMRAGKD